MGVLKDYHRSGIGRLLRVESFLIVLILVASLAMVFIGCFVAKDHQVIGIIMCILGGAIVIGGAFVGVKIEHDAGYYECPECKERYVPTMSAVVWARHIGTSRKMKCPYCGNKAYHKKVLTK